MPWFKRWARSPAKRYWLRVYYTACHETKCFFQGATSTHPVAAAMVSLYVAGFAVYVVALGSGRHVAAATTDVAPLIGKALAGYIALMVAVFIWEAARAPSSISVKQAEALARSRTARAVAGAAHIASDVERRAEIALILKHLSELRAENAKVRPNVEPECDLYDSAIVKGGLFVVNTGSAAAIDVTLAPVGRMRFSVVRALKTSDPKREVEVFYDTSDDNPFRAFSNAQVTYRPGRKRAPKEVSDHDGAKTAVNWYRFADYVPLCLTYRDNDGTLYHTHDYVLSIEGAGKSSFDQRLFVKRASDSDITVFGAAS